MDGPDRPDRLDATLATLAPRMEAMSPRLLVWVRLRLGSHVRTEPEDVVQEVWCRVLDRFHAFDPASRSFEGWVFNIAKFILLETVRRSRIHERVRLTEGRSSMVRILHEVPESITTMTHKVARREGMQEFTHALSQLEPDDQKLYVLCGLENRKHADVAAQLGIGKEAVTKRWQRLRVRLRQLKPPSGLELENG
jgi:RNA polymerase sigma factor (sigma-70 family)